jgi:hypothetical protein
MAESGPAAAEPQARGTLNSYGIRRTDMTHKDHIEKLDGLLGKLAPRDKVFASSLSQQFKSRGKLSSKQWAWVAKLIERAEAPPPPPPKKMEVGDLQALYRMFGFAKQHLKYPKIHLQAGDQPVMLAVAGERSKYNGKIMVTDGQPYGRNKWWGAIDASGCWEHPRAGVPDAVVDLIRRMAADPSGTATAHGSLTGHCCFCNSKLTDGRSKVVGYGPTCAKNFNLAWGTAKQAREMEREWATA